MDIDQPRGSRWVSISREDRGGYRSAVRSREDHGGYRSAARIAVDIEYRSAVRIAVDIDQPRGSRWVSISSVINQLSNRLPDRGGGAERPLAPAPGRISAQGSLQQLRLPHRHSPRGQRVSESASWGVGAGTKTGAYLATFLQKPRLRG